ncbi:MAG: protein kinase, partial [Chloroflexota bacterium]
MADELIGKTIGGYDVLSRIGEGGMATVYLAKQHSMDRQVALKVLPKHFVKDDTYMERFKREVAIVSKLEHRGIIPVYDYGEFEGQPYIVMRYMPSGSLDDMLKNGPIKPDKIYSIIQQIASALDYAHSKHVLHRDLKPSNVLMDDAGGAFITDFGIARALGDNNPGLTTQGVVGTPSYMSPEQAQGKDLDGRSDVYSLGVVLFEMATGKRPFENETPYSIAVMQVTETPPMPRKLNPALSTALEVVILKALKKSRDDRYQTAEALAESLKLAIERPIAVHDTEPRLKMQSYTERLADEETKPPSKPKNQYVPPMHHQSSGASRPVVPPPSSLRSKIRKRRQQSPVLSALIGGSIGCGLLGIIVAAAFLAFSVLLPSDLIAPATAPSDENDIATSSVATEVTRTSDVTEESTFATLDPTSEVALATLRARNTATSEDAVVTPLVIDTPAPPSISGGNRPQLLPLLDAVNGTIIFADERGDNNTFEIMSLNLASWVDTQLTSDPNADSTYPLASPDGQWIAFQSNRDVNPNDFDIFIVNRGGGSLRRLTFDERLNRLPAWTPDSQSIIYSQEVEDSIFDLRQVDIDDPNTDTLIYSNGGYNGHARYSPDGRYIV